MWQALFRVSMCSIKFIRKKDLCRSLCAQSCPWVDRIFTTFLPKTYRQNLCESDLGKWTVYKDSFRKPLYKNTFAKYPKIISMQIFFARSLENSLQENSRLPTEDLQAKSLQNRGLYFSNPLLFFRIFISLRCSANALTRNLRRRLKMNFLLQSHRYDTHTQRRKSNRGLSQWKLKSCQIHPNTTHAMKS